MNVSRIAKGFRKGIALAVVTGALLGASAYAADTPPADPVAMATTLEKQAADYRAEAAKHDRMGQMHRGGAGSSKMNHESVVKHCEAIAKSLRAAADESEALAAEYRKSSK